MVKDQKYTHREGKDLEFKLRLSDYNRLAKTCVAFANTNGGTVLVGIEDKTRIVKGLDEELIDRYCEEVPRAIYQMVTPHLLCHPFEQNVFGKSVFGIHIYSGNNKPYYLTKEGPGRGVYVRVGSHTMRANEFLLQELKLSRENRSYDEGLVYSLGSNALDKVLIKQTLKLKKVDERILESHFLLGKDHISKTYHPTIGGVLFFHSNPSEYVNEAYISCARMKGSSGRDIIELQEFSGPLVTILDAVIVQLESWLERDFKLNGTKLQGKLLVSHEALREGIYNACFHRKYNIPGPIKITLWENRLEIFNPGQFVNIMHPDMLGDGTTYIRNRVVCSLARKARFMEKRGTGIRIILDTCRAQGNVVPTFQEGGDWVKLTFTFLDKKRTIPITTQDKFENLLHTKECLTNRMVVQVCGVSRQTANNMLKSHVKRGLLIPDGKGRGRKYICQLP